VPSCYRLGARMRFLLKSEKGSTRAVTNRLGVTQRTVKRHVKGTLRRPRAWLAARLEREVLKDWQPRVQQWARKRASTATGIVIETRARFGFTAAPGATDDGRMCRITQHLRPAFAARLFEAQAAGTAEQQLQTITAEGLQEIYVKDRGRRAQGLEVKFTDIDYIELEFYILQGALRSMRKTLANQPGD
jgi:hypothetical protein